MIDITEFTQGGTLCFIFFHFGISSTLLSLRAYAEFELEDDKGEGNKVLSEGLLLSDALSVSGEGDLYFINLCSCFHPSYEAFRLEEVEQMRFCLLLSVPRREPHHQTFRPRCGLF